MAGLDFKTYCVLNVSSFFRLYAAKGHLQEEVLPRKALLGNEAVPCNRGSIVFRSSFVSWFSLQFDPEHEGSVFLRNSVSSIGLHVVTFQKTVFFMNTAQTNTSQSFYTFNLGKVVLY
jgi:hypothetical protein